MYKKLMSKFLYIVKLSVISLLIGIIIENYIVGLTIIHGSSMLSTIKEKDKVLVNKIHYKFTKPKRGEIIIFRPPIDRNELFIKRVIAVEGDKFEIKENDIYINGKLLLENYIEREKYFERDYNILNGTVPKGHVFVLGDNRNNSNDSRTFGFVSLDNIKGKAISKIWPFEGVKTFAVNYE
ncbi:signal peptidase I, bacterial type [Gottschalkia purinilytica]|uniref:Signal peptidase I n=1 Tax=Gottschalkia purinilytica TaxID=1503 RepID=A0A0L0WF85_GOTPU|nr:signal peptidase I [Gottschalkia purinilytica]KNF10147.1 signal peptidase I, bacterial type [Gottschalkia purinilytica]